MADTKRRIPLDVAQKVLLAFGITERTREYDRWIKDEDGPNAGFDLEDFNEVLFDSPFVLIVDWRDELQEDLEFVQAMMHRLGVTLEVHIGEEDNDGFVSCGAKLAAVAYTPNDGPDFDEVIAALQRVVPPHVEFRSCPGFEGSDGWCYAAQHRDVWAELDREAPLVIDHYFPRGSFPRPARS